MNPEQLQQMVRWLNQQIINSSESLNEAHQLNNYCKQTEFEGMKEAYQRCLLKMSQI